MADIQTQLPVRITDGTNTVGILTNNNAAPVANNVGSLVALANTAAPSYTDGNQVLLSVDPSGGLRVNVSSGTVTTVASGTQAVSGTVTAIASGTQAVSGTVTAIASGTQPTTGTLTNNNAAPAANNLGVLPARATTAVPSYTEGNQVLLSTDLTGALRVAGTFTSSPSGTQAVSGTVTNVPSGTQAVSGTVTNVPSGTQVVTGTLTNNNAAPAATNFGVLSARATTAVPSYTEGNQVLLSTDLTGALRVVTTSTGTQPVSGTITAVQSGTYAVSGTVTNVPSGTQTVTGTVSTSPGEMTTGIVASYGTSTSVANGSTGTISYTVTAAKTLYLKGVWASSSGAPCKVTIDYGAGPTVLGVGFYATSSPMIQFVMQQPVAIAASTVVNVKIQNNSGLAQDVYASIWGHELP